MCVNLHVCLCASVCESVKVNLCMYANEVRNDWRSMRTWVHLMGRPGEEQGDYAGKDKVIEGRM